VEDLYPSRNLPDATIEPRRDLVLRGGVSAPGPLNRDQLAAFDENGFLFLDRFFSEQEVSGFLDEFDHLKSREDLQDDPKLIREPDSADVRSIFYVHKISPLYARLAADPRLTAMIRQILNSNVYIHQSRINLKPGFSGKEFYWHSDFETWHVEDGMPRMRAVSCCITLSENNEFNGALMLIPGSHQHFVACPGETPEDHYKQSLRRQSVGVPDSASLLELLQGRALVAPKGPAGCLLLFECNTMHGSNSNISPYPRSNIFFCYNSVENQLVEPFGGLKPRPEYVASRDFTPLAD
jgi:ectoine hydroxylase